MRAETAHQARLLRLLRDTGPRSRAELGPTLALARSTVAVEADRLLALGLVDEAGLAQSRGGRRATVLQVAPRLRFAGIDIGATSVDVALTDGQLRVLAVASGSADIRSGPEVVLRQARELLGELRTADPDGQLLGAGVGVPGPVRFRDGTPVAPPIMPGWDQYPVRDQLARDLGVPVLLDNDVNIMALGELHAGAARGQVDFLFVKIGTGIGCGIVVDGQLYRGVDGSAGDIGHIRVEDFGPACACGNTGCLEAFFGGTALARDAIAAARAGRSEVFAEILRATGGITAADVGTAYAAGDPEAVALVRDGGRRVGQVLASLVSFFNPGMIVVGGGVAQVGAALLAEIRAAVYRRSLPLATASLPIVASDLDGRAGVIGGARMISDAVFSV